MITRASVSRLFARIATSLGDWRLRGWSAALFICAVFALAFAVRWFLLGELSARLLFPSFLLAVFIATWVVGVRAGVLGTAITMLTGTIVYSSDTAGLTSRDLYSLGFVLTLCCIGLAVVAKARRNRDQLRAGRRWYGSLLDHSTEAIGFVADDGSLRYLNRSARKLWNVDEAIIDRAASLALPLQRDGLPFSFNVASSGTIVYGKRRPLPAGLMAQHAGEWIPVTGCATWVDDPAYGKGLVFSLQWNEALRDATTELAVTRQQLDALLEANVVGVAALQSDGRRKSGARRPAGRPDPAGAHRHARLRRRAAHPGRRIDLGIAQPRHHRRRREPDARHPHRRPQAGGAASAFPPAVAAVDHR
jgi:PAS domain-containing protein